MCICKLCFSGEIAADNQHFEAVFNGIQFNVTVHARKPLERIEICPDCAAKGALMVLGAEKPKCADGKCNCPPVEM